MTTDIATYQGQAQELALPDRAYMQRELRAVRDFQAAVHELLVKDQDYGVIPGTAKPTLFKPGAEKMTKILGLADTYQIVDKIEDWDRPLFRYLVRCQLVSVRTGAVVSECMGECNTMEARYRWRNAQRRCPSCGAEAIIAENPKFGSDGFVCWKKKDGCGTKFSKTDPSITNQAVGKVENEDIYSLVNTVLKMAQKRALVGAALSAGRLSEIFTQDMEDLRPTDGIIEGDARQIDDNPQQQAPRQQQGFVRPQGSAPRPPTAEAASKPMGRVKLNEINDLASQLGLTQAEIQGALQAGTGLSTMRGMTNAEGDRFIAFLIGLLELKQEAASDDDTDPVEPGDDDSAPF